MQPRTCLLLYPIRLNITGTLTISEVMLIIFIPKFFVGLSSGCVAQSTTYHQNVHVYVCVSVSAPKHRYALNNETFVFDFFCFPPLHTFVYCCNYYVIVAIATTTTIFVRQARSVFIDSLSVGSCCT